MEILPSGNLKLRFRRGDKEYLKELHISALFELALPGTQG